MGNCLTKLFKKRNDIDEALFIEVEKHLYQQDTPTYENNAAFRYRETLITERFNESVQLVKHIMRAEPESPIIMFYDGHCYQAIDNDDTPPISALDW